jgi:hypothetical protein
MALISFLRRRTSRPEDVSGCKLPALASRPLWLKLRIELQEIVIEFAF